VAGLRRGGTILVARGQLQHRPAFFSRKSVRGFGNPPHTKVRTHCTARYQGPAKLADQKDYGRKPQLRRPSGDCPLSKAEGYRIRRGRQDRFLPPHKSTDTAPGEVMTGKSGEGPPSRETSTHRVPRLYGDHLRATRNHARKKKRARKISFAQYRASVHTRVLRRGAGEGRVPNTEKR